MTIDFEQYQPPGVYVSEDTTATISVTGTEPTIVALVGPSVGYRSGTQSFTLGTASTLIGGTDNDTVFQTGSNAPVVTTISGQVLVLNTDYRVDTAGGTFGIKTTSADANARLNSTVVVSYRYLPDGYTNPVIYDDYDDVTDAFGQPLVLGSVASGTNQITSPLSLAAQVAFANGASKVMLVAYDPTAGSMQQQMADALSKIEVDYRVGLVVPVFDGTYGNSLVQAQAIATALLNHCITATNEGYPRIGILGVGSTWSDSDAGFSSLANGLNNRRIVVSYPQALSYYNGYSNSTIAVDGYYLAAAEAGRLTSLTVQTPLTKKVISGFVGIPPSIQRAQTQASKNALAVSGVCVVEQNRYSNIVVRHGLTTEYGGGLLAREISVVRARDVLFTALQVGLDNSGLIGTPIDFETLTKVKAAVSGILENATQREVILSYNNLKARQTTDDPSVIEVKFTYAPALPLNYITVSFAVNVQTGDTTGLSTAA